jgi:hypothetical protein
LNDLLANVVSYQPWLKILGKTKPDIRMRDEELALRFFAFHLHGVDSYRTPQKHWLNEAAKSGAKYSQEKIQELSVAWHRSIDISLQFFAPKECFRRDHGPKAKAVNRALFDLIMQFSAQIRIENIEDIREPFRERYYGLLENAEFSDLISRAVDHTKRTKRRFELWNNAMADLLV